MKSVNKANSDGSFLARGMLILLAGVLFGSCAETGGGDSSGTVNPITGDTYRVHATFINGGNTFTNNGKTFRVLAFPANCPDLSPENVLAYTNDEIMGGTCSDMFNDPEDMSSYYDFAEGHYDFLAVIDYNSTGFFTDGFPDEGDYILLKRNVLIDSYDDVIFDFHEFEEWDD